MSRLVKYRKESRMVQKLREWLIKKFLGSRKFWVALCTVLLLKYKDELGIDEKTAKQMATVAGAYLVGQGMADFGKEKKNT